MEKMSNIIIPNPQKLDLLKTKLQNDGAKNLHILADFDRTLTYSTRPNGEKIKSIIAVLRDENYLSPEYSTQAKGLFAKYHPIEIDPEISLEEKKESMNKWWTSHNQLLINSGLNKSHLEKIVESGIIRLREGTKELFEYTNQNDIPLVIMSASGLGDTIQMILEKENMLYNNIYIITNKFDWNEKGYAAKTQEKPIHGMNKDETTIQQFPEIYEKIKNRKNIILLGDSLGDLGMTTGFDYNNLLKIGFLNPEEEQNQKQYEQNFNLIITKDSSISPVNKILEKIK
jgi:HAD superfamily hydrolase (TIGR01544 family)